MTMGFGVSFHRYRVRVRTKNKRKRLYKRGERLYKHDERREIASIFLLPDYEKAVKRCMTVRRLVR